MIAVSDESIIQTLELNSLLENTDSRMTKELSFHFSIVPLGQ